MANSYKNIIITPNIGSNSDPKIVFSGANSASNTDVALYVYPVDNGTLSFEGTAGQLFSVSNRLDGTIFSVNDVSGIPSIEVEDNGAITFSRFSGNVGIGTYATDKFHVLGNIKLTGAINANSSIGTVGQVLTSTGSLTYWSTLANTNLVQANLTTLTSGVNGIQANINLVQGNVATLTTSVNTIKANVDSVASNVTSILTGTTSFTGSKTFAGPVVLSNTLSANGSVGSAGQVLASNASGVYWTTPVTTGKAIAMAIVFGG